MLKTINDKYFILYEFYVIFMYIYFYYLAILREMILSTGGEEEMSALLGTLHTADHTCIPLKSSILKLFLSCMKESHRTRTMFRKIDGFVYVVSALVSMEGWFSSDKHVDQEALKFAYTICNTITIAMRFEPANAKYFHQEVSQSKSI